MARYFKQTKHLWRGSLLPLDCEAGPSGGRFATEREQAPSPQMHLQFQIKSPLY
ncbi:UNVERIFIED_ORG: hypothetical protein J2Y77_001480 [Pseudomonas lini]